MKAPQQPTSVTILRTAPTPDAEPIPSQIEASDWRSLTSYQTHRMCKNLQLVLVMHPQNDGTQSS